MNDGKNWLPKFLFCHTRETKPDRRPLYAYKCRDKDYEAMKALLRDCPKLSQQSNPYFKRIFCLYAAEAFRREHVDGAWTWDTVFKPLGTAAPDQPHIAEWVETGLRYWQRNLIVGQNGHRRFLVTIACEGGLPLRLLHKENAHLRRFFIALLEEYHRQGGGGVDIAETIAAQQAPRFLPPSLCHDVVFRLGGELIAKIIELQQEIGEAVNPIAALDRQNPRWRSELPLSAEDQTVEALLGGLVRRSSELARAAKAGLGWRGWLKKSAPGFVVEKHLEFPDSLTIAQVQASIGQQNLPARLHLILHTPHGGEAVARLTSNGGTDDTAIFRREWLRRGGVRLVGASTQEWHRLVWHDGDKEHGVSLRGGETWEKELPWVFVARNGAEDCAWLAEGSAKTRATEAWVAVPDGFAIEPLDAASCDCAGEIAAIRRKVYHLAGTADFVAADQARYRVECRADVDSACQYSIWGETVADALNEMPLYLGVPHLKRLDADGKQQVEPTQWKPVGIQSEWASSAIGGVGLLWLRCLDGENGIEKFRRQVAVLPRQLRIEREIGQATTPGCYRISGLEAANARLVSPAEATLESGPEDGQIRIECPALSATALPILRLALAWHGGNPIELRLPYPQRGASFRLGGQALRQGDWVPLDRLGGLRALIQDHAGGSRFKLHVSLIADADAAGKHRGFHHRLPMLQQGQRDFGLYDWHDRIASLLSSSPLLDARVRLEITSSHEEILACVHVARFDAILEPDREQTCVNISADSLPRLEQGWESRVSLEMIRLWAPCETPVPLEACLGQPGVWRIPANLEPGPWWVVGRDGGWARFRPLLWTIQADGELAQTAEPASALAQAIRALQQERERLFPPVLTALGEDPNHPDWPLLFDYFKLTREFPPNSLDVLSQLTQHPRSLAMALLKADVESFERVWAFAEFMPFSWGLVSIRDWEHAAFLYFNSLRAALAVVETGEEIVWGIFQGFRERAQARRAYWRPLCDWLQERLFPSQPAPPNSELRLARLAVAQVEAGIAQAEQELQSRHDADEHWPQSPEAMAFTENAPTRWKSRFAHLSHPFRAIRYAPFVVAHISLNGIQHSDSLIYELRLLRQFDPEWFDTAYAMALTVGLAALPQETSP